MQFEPKQRDANGKQVTDICIRTVGSQKLVNITIWPEYQLTQPIKRGDFVAVDGAYEVRSFQGQDGAAKESLQISPTSLVVIPAVPKADRQVVQAAPVAVAQATAGSAPF